MDRPPVARGAVTKSNGPAHRLQALIGSGMSYRAVKRENAEFAPIPTRTLWKMNATGEVPKKWRNHFNLPPLDLAPVCPACGVVHVRACPAIRKEDRTRFRPDLGPDLGSRATAHAAAQGLTLGEWVRDILETKLYEEE